MKFEDYGLEGEMLAKAQADYESSLNEKVEGLKNKNAELIDREKKVKESNDSLMLEMSTKEENAKVLLAEKEGTVEQYKNAVTERDQKIDSIKREFQESESKRVLSDAVNDFSVGLVDDPASRMYMQSLFKEGVEIKDGVVSTKDVTSNVDDFKALLVSDKANAKHIKANVGSGTGSAGSDGNFSEAPETNKAADEAKAKGDGIGHLNAHFKNTFNKGN